MTLSLDPMLVMQTAGTWRSQSAELEGARTALEELDPNSLGTARVSGAASAYLSHWAGAITTLKNDAESHADNLETFVVLITFSDDDAAAAVTGLLPGEA